MPGGFAACMPYGLYIFLPDFHNSIIVLFYSASARSIHREHCSIYIFKHLHTSTVMFHNKYASLRLHDSNATRPSTPQGYSVMHSVCFFLSAYALINF